LFDLEEKKAKAEAATHLQEELDANELMVLNRKVVAAAKANREGKTNMLSTPASTIKSTGGGGIAAGGGGAAASGSGGSSQGSSGKRGASTSPIDFFDMSLDMLLGSGKKRPRNLEDDEDQNSRESIRVMLMARFGDMCPIDFCAHCKIHDVLVIETIANLGVEVLILSFVESPNIHSSEHMTSAGSRMKVPYGDCMKIFASFQRVMRESKKEAEV